MYLSTNTKQMQMFKLTIHVSYKQAISLLDAQSLVANPSMVPAKGDGSQPRYASAMKKVSVGLAEFFGTATLVFVSCMGASRWINGGYIPPFQSSLAAGFAVTIAIHNFGHISGAHVNPVTTVCALIMEQISLDLVPVYVVAQITGGAAGYGLIKIVTPGKFMKGIETQVDQHGIGMNIPSADISSVQALVVEILITFILVFANCSSWDPRSKHLVDSVAIRFGLVVAGLNFAAASYTGASMNPARSFGPAVWNNDWYLHWIYWVGPLTSAVIGSVVYKYVFLKTNFQDYSLS